MAARRPIPDAKDAMILFLQRQLESERKLNLALMQQLAEKDRQIAMVLEKHYEQPIVTRREPVPEPQVRFESAQLDENQQFDPKADQAQRDKDEKAFQDASRRLEDELQAEFDAIAADHADRREHARTPGAFKAAEDAAHEAARAVAVAEEGDTE